MASLSAGFYCGMLSETQLFFAPPQVSPAQFLGK